MTALTVDDLTTWCHLRRESCCELWANVKVHWLNDDLGIPDRINQMLEVDSVLGVDNVADPYSVRMVPVVLRRHVLEHPGALPCGPVNDILNG